MPVFNTTTALDWYITNVTIEQIASIVSNEAVKASNEAIEETVYANPDTSPDAFYQNKFGLRDSAQSKKYKYGSGVVNTGTMVEVEFVPSHDYESFYDSGNVDNRNNIVDWLNNGHKGFYKGVVMRTTSKGSGFIKLAISKLKKGGHLKKDVEGRLASLGYVISRRFSNNGGDE